MELDTDPKGSIQIETVVNGPIETNTYFVISGAEAVVIDPAWDGAKLTRDFEKGYPGVTIRAIISTHGHADHVGGVAAMRKELGADVAFLISAADAALIGTAIKSMKERWGVTVEDPGEPSRLLAEGDTIEFGDAVLQVIETPGHTPGGIVLFTATDQGDIAFVGDTLFPSSHGRTDLEGGDECAMLHSLTKLARLLPADTHCLVGHGRSTTMAEELEFNPFMSAS
ncbi:beta-lactamase domain protein [Coriobacterium glomerans PW2]|uniref:Beta-lactamase domain protein n=1 Tax=Coriobacterium glomerans (strain ATCC 49209 / DSM 20642 / JCM 10262 / PW2) TaxID=700015 RepID=F2NBI9_CORGP|nr:MBL fold metallo-hydrolase [Coriobacterium glomerans]AEB06725.1 beta-lactamase domain protein [Coriobacterium glomerans PW2]